MSYPKPLSEKTVNKKYEDLGLSAEQIEYVHDFTLACVNLYGAVYAADVWDIYRELSGRIETPVLHRRDMYNAFDIMRREEVPYYVYEIDELYDDRENSEDDRMLILKSLVGSGRNKNDMVLNLLTSLRDVDYFIPDDIVSYKDMPVAKEERMLGNTLSVLSGFNGVKLSDIGFEDYEGNAAERILHDLKCNLQIGYKTAEEAAQETFNALVALGVSLNQSQADHVADRISDFANNLHEYCLCGWTINDLNAMRA